MQPATFYKANPNSSSDSMTAKSKGKSGQAMGDGAAGDDMLPEIGHKFSSWSKEDQNLNELDDLLMEHDLLAQPAGGPRQNKQAAAVSAAIR